MKPLQEAIKKKYGVSDEVSKQVIGALAEIEKHRQSDAGGQVQGFRARTTSEQGETNRQVSVPDIATIVNNNSQSNSGTRSQSNVNVGGTGLIGIVISIIFSLLKMFIGSRVSSSQNNSGSVINILNDLTNGATIPGQAPDLTNILGGLLGGSGSGHDLDSMVTDMLNNHTSPSTGQPKLSKPKPR